LLSRLRRFAAELSYDFDCVARLKAINDTKTLLETLKFEGWELFNSTIGPREQSGSSNVVSARARYQQPRCLTSVAFAEPPKFSAVVGAAKVFRQTTQTNFDHQLTSVTSSMSAKIKSLSNWLSKSSVWLHVITRGSVFDQPPDC